MIELPLSQLTPVPSGRRRVSAVTGTGLAPSLFMSTTPGNRDDDILIFGYRTGGDDLTALLPDPIPTMLRCINREDADGALRGRATNALGTLDFDLAGTDLYLCGSSAMVANGIALLESRGAEYLFTELYWRRWLKSPDGRPSATGRRWSTRG